MFRILSAIVLVAGLLPLSVCLAADDDMQELAVWTGWRYAGFKAAMRQFEVEHPGWKVIRSTAAGAGGMDPQKLMCAIAGGSPPDTLVQDRFSVGEWAIRDAFLALDEYIAESQQQEKWACAIRDAIAAGKLSEASEPIEKLAAALKEVGRSRQMEILSDIRAGIADGMPAEDLKKLAADLAEICEGIDPADYYKACWEEACFGVGDERRVFAVPNSTDDRALYYNEDLFERAGLVDENGVARPPKNWKELREFGRKLTERDASGKLVRVGFAPNYGNSWLYMYGWLNGGAFMSKDGRTCTLNDPLIAEALQFMVDVYDDIGGIEKVEAFQSGFGAGEFDPFLTGLVAMKVDGNGVQNQIVNYAPNLRYNVVITPAGPSGERPITWSGGFSWVIPVGSRHPRMAFEFIRFMMSDRIINLRNDVNSKFAISQGRSFIPPMSPKPESNRKAYELLVQGNVDLPQRVKECFVKFADMMKVSKFRPVTPVGQLLWGEHRRASDEAFRHRYTPQEALDISCKKGQERLDEIFEERDDPKVNCAYPVAGMILLLVCGAGIAYLRNGRMSLVRRLMRRESLAGYSFASPWLIGLMVLTAGPIVVSVIFSFCSYDVLHEAEFVGLENYRRLFGDSLFWKSLGNTAFMMLGIPLGMAVGLGVAMLLNAKVKGMQAYRTIFYLPAIVPVVASSILWIWVLNPEQGLLNSFLRMFGVTDPPLWLQSESLLFGSKISIILMGLWGAGAGMIIWLAGLKGIPAHLYEAADIDGAGTLDKFFHITLPMLSPYIFFNLVMGIIGTLQIFAQAYIMTDGGPADSTLFYVFYLFNKAFRHFEMGYASALAWILFILILALTLFQLKLAPKWVHYEAE